jgi:hypothetical protein
MMITATTLVAFVFQVLSFGILMSMAFQIGRWITKKTMPWAYRA